MDITKNLANIMFEIFCWPFKQAANLQTKLFCKCGRNYFTPPSAWHAFVLNKNFLNNLQWKLGYFCAYLPNLSSYSPATTLDQVLSPHSALLPQPCPHELLHTLLKCWHFTSVHYKNIVMVPSIFATLSHFWDSKPLCAVLYSTIFTTRASILLAYCPSMKL